MSLPTYSIRDWSKHFENNRTRELKELRFVILPNKHDGDGYTELLDHPNGAAHYGAWCAIVQVASKCEPRGTLIRSVGTIPQEGAATSQGGATPHDPRSLSRLTRIPSAIFAEVLPRLVSIGWMEAVDVQAQETQPHRTIPQGVGTKPHPPAENRPRTEWNRIEQKESATASAVARNGKDPSLDNESVKLYREICHITPNHEQRALIVKTVTRPVLYAEVLRGYMTEGQKPQRVDWTLERYAQAVGQSKEAKEERQRELARRGGYEYRPDAS